MALNVTTAWLSSSEEEEYEYDLDEALATFDLYETVPVGLVYSLTLLLGVVGNVIIIYTIIMFRRMRSITNVFLASLASADLLLVTICVPIKLAKLLSYTWTFGEFLCKFVHYVQNVSVFCSVLTLTAMSLERYYAILHPMKAKYICTISQARKVIVGIWLLSIVMAVPILFVQVMVPAAKGHYWCMVDFENPTLWQVYEVYMLVLLLVVPAVIMGYAYACICREVWRVMQQRAVMIGSNGDANRNGKDSSSDKEAYPMTTFGRSNRRHKKKTSSSLPCTAESVTVRQVVKMLVAVVVLFVLCWTPLLVTNVLTAFQVLPVLHYGFLKPLRITFHLLAYANSCINPIVYGFMSRSFRDSFVGVACACRRSQRPRWPHRQPSFATTRTTSVSLGRSCSISTAHDATRTTMVQDAC